jgi:hypothetical protein
MVTATATVGGSSNNDDGAPLAAPGGGVEVIGAWTAKTRTAVQMPGHRWRQPLLT